MTEPRSPAAAGATGRQSNGLVLIVTPGGTQERGGMGRIVANFTRHWEQTGTGPDYRVIDPYGPGRLWIAPFYLAAAMVRLMWLSARHGVRLVHIHMASRGSVVRKGLMLLLAKATGAPVILHLHAGDFAQFYHGLPVYARRLLLRLIRLADLTIVLGRPWRDFLVEQLGLPPGRVAVLPNAVPRHRKTARSANRQGQICQLLYLGRLEDKKGIPELLRALADPRLRALSWRASLVGGGEVERFRAELDRLGLSDRVDCPGWQDEAEVARRLGSAEVFVLPSHAEGLSMALLEALAEEMVVIATAVGAIPEVIEDGVSGLLVPAGDAAALMEVLVRVIEQPDLRAELAAGARRCFNEKFEISVYCDELEGIYNRLAKR